MLKTCPNCNAEFETYARNHKYCSTTCRRTHYAKKLNKTIPIDYKAKDYNAQNFKNLVQFFAPELNQILRGEPTTQILSLTERQTLQFHNIICRTRIGSRVYYRLTPIGKHELNKVNQTC